MDMQQWQAELDKDFPAAVNVRLSNGNPDNEIDFISATLTVVKVVGDAVTLWFGDVSNNGKAWLLTGTLTKVQDTPFARYTFEPVTRGSKSYNFQFWARPLTAADDPVEFAKTKSGAHETGLALASQA